MPSGHNPFFMYGNCFIQATLYIMLSYELNQFIFCVRPHGLGA